MTRHCFSCSASRSERAPARRARSLAIALIAALLAGPAALASEGLGRGRPACGDGECGTVRGSISVWQAALRTEGPKHDRGVVVYLEGAATRGLPAGDGRAVMDQKELVFVPHVLAVEKGTTVTFLNSDPDEHNVYFLDDRTGGTLDIGTWGPGVSVDHRFEVPGVVITLCKLHLEMAAYVVVVEGPWFTTVELDPASASGTFEITGVPAGEYRLTAWHKKLRQKGGAAPITVLGGGTTEVEVVITKAKYAGTTD